MRIRTVKPEWATNEKLQEAGDAARVLSIGLITLSDDHGNGMAGIGLIAGKIWTLELEKNPRETLAKVSRTLEILEEMQYIHLYENDGKRYFHIVGWQRHQRVDKPGKPHVPGPNESLFTDFGTIRESLASPQQNLAPGPKDLWIYGSMDQGINGSMDQCTEGPKELLSTSDKPKPDVSTVRAIFEHWSKTFGKRNTTKLTTQRRSCIKARLRDYEPQDLLDAISGASKDPWLLENNYTDLTTILKASAIERHIERHRGHAPAGAETSGTHTDVTKWGAIGVFDEAELARESL